MTLLQNSWGLSETENRAVIEKADIQVGYRFLKNRSA
jgi:hypothetical protein